jgi:hypothetical protein
MSLTMSGYKELGLKLISLEERISHMPKKTLMECKNKDDGTGDPFKMFLDESLM